MIIKRKTEYYQKNKKEVEGSDKGRKMNLR